MQRYDFFFGQKVTEGELDAAFEAVEQLERNLHLDQGIVGILAGAVVSENAGTPNLTVDVSGPAAIRDQLGRRISWSATQDVDLSVDELGNPTAVATSGNEKWLSIFAKWKRVPGDPRVDASGATVFFDQAEGYEIRVAQGAEAATGLATRPPLRADEVLLADVKLVFGQTQILNADIDTTRRESAFKFVEGTVSVDAGQPEEAMRQLAQQMTSTLDLADNTAPDDGATRVGVDAIAGTPSSIAQGTVKSALAALLAAVNDRVSLTLDDVITAIKQLDAGGYLNALATKPNSELLVQDDRALGGSPGQDRILIGSYSGGAVNVYLTRYYATGILSSYLVPQVEIAINAFYDFGSGQHLPTTTPAFYWRIVIGGGDIRDAADPEGIVAAARVELYSGTLSGGIIAWDKPLGIIGKAEPTPTDLIPSLFSAVVNPATVTSGLAVIQLDGAGGITVPLGWGVASAGASIVGTTDILINWQIPAPTPNSQLVFFTPQDNVVRMIVLHPTAPFPTELQTQFRIYDSSTGALLDPNAIVTRIYVQRHILGG